jgi:hypothetical protein
MASCCCGSISHGPGTLETTWNFCPPSKSVLSERVDILAKTESLPKTTSTVKITEPLRVIDLLANWMTPLLSYCAVDVQLTRRGELNEFRSASTACIAIGSSMATFSSMYPESGSKCLFTVFLCTAIWMPSGVLACAMNVTIASARTMNANTTARRRPARKPFAIPVRLVIIFDVVSTLKPTYLTMMIREIIHLKLVEAVYISEATLVNVPFC